MSNEDKIQKKIDRINEINHQLDDTNYWFKEIRPEVDDMVNEPKHYDFFDTTVLDVIEKTLTHDEFMGFLKGNSLKYRLRCGKKDNMNQEIGKAEYYENRYQQYLEKNSP